MQRYPRRARGPEEETPEKKGSLQSPEGRDDSIEKPGVSVHSKGRGRVPFYGRS